MQIEATAEPQVCPNDNVQKTTSPTDGVRGKPLASEEDDVQIIFCAPRRRKKRRRRHVTYSYPFQPLTHVSRLESHYSASTVNQDYVAPAGPPGPKIHHVLPQEPRRRSIGVIQRLELCQIGEEKSPSVRAGSLPSMSYGADSVPSIQYPWFAEPTYYGMPACQFPSLKDSATWSDQSLPTLQTRPLPSIPWKPIHVEGQNPMKRKHDDGLHETSVRPSRSRQSVPTSPRTTPPSETLPSFSPPLTYSYPWGTYAPDEYFPASPNCPGNGWDAFDRTGHYNYEPNLSRDISLPSELSSPDTAIAAKPTSYRSSVSNMFGGRRETGAWQQNGEPVKAAFSSSSDLIPNIECPHLPGGGEQLRRHVHSPNPHSSPHALPPPSSMIALSNINNPHALQLGAHPRSRRQETPVHASTASVPPRNNTRFAKSYDMLRKPSLYSITPWPNPLDPAKSSLPFTTAQAHTKSQDSNANGSSGSNGGVNQARVNHDKPSLHLPNAVVAQRTEFGTRQEATGITPANAATAVSSATQAPCSSNAPTFQIPKVRLGRKHSPNLYVRYYPSETPL